MLVLSLSKSGHLQSLSKHLQKLSALGDTVKSPALGKTDEIIADPCSKSPLVFPTHFSGAEVWRETPYSLLWCGEKLKLPWSLGLGGVGGGREWAAAEG